MSEAANVLQESEQPDRMEQRRKYESEHEQSSAEASTPETLNSRQPLALNLSNGSVVSRQTSTWQDTLWREWRNTNDEDYAKHLFELVADEPVDHVAIIANVLLGLFYGGLIGLLIGLLGALSDSLAWTQTFLTSVIIGAISGGVLGFLWRLVGPGLTWRTWLSRLTLNLAPNELGLVGVALIFGLFGSQIGWLLGWSAGLGHQIGIVGVSIVLAGTLGARLVGWMVGLSREPNANYLHGYRTLWFWWRKRSLGIEVEAALQRACAVVPAAQNKWVEILQNLEQRKKKQEPLEELIAHLQSRDWVKRFTAVHLLAASGGEAVAHLQPLATRITSSQRGTAIRLLQSIEQETTVRLAQDADWLLCPHCLARCGAHTVSISDDTKITYYGCRLCGQSREFWEGEVVAVLDANMGGEPLQRNGTIRINWLARRELFDFHWVEIVRATDQDVERFAVQVGNDTDPVRRLGYKQMRCVVDPACGLSENTLRILARIFGQVTESRWDDYT